MKKNRIKPDHLKLKYGLLFKPQFSIFYLDKVNFDVNFHEKRVELTDALTLILNYLRKVSSNLIN